ncbi:MAG: hypothetical protein DWQ37_23710 [Planctomycetota bacterium]|nr:MAG: hypothetical protein DWQ37_23710 [Planctomycetota bacterium]
MSKNGRPLRFAALIRVSTEKQERQGESLKTQDTQLKHAVDQLGGKITKRYAGQEHATSGWERQQLDALLADAKKQRRPFDAVIVADPSRWSRDNTASEAGLQTFRDHGVRFFVLTTEYDLFDPHALLFIALNTTIGAFHARNQMQKSLKNRIERAKRGLPVSGKLPFGRTFDKAKQQWGIDKKKQKMMEDIAKRYLAGEKLEHLAREYRLNHSSLHKNLTKRCGDTWEQTFHSDDLNIHEVVPTPIPRLLPQRTIKAILRQAEANKTYQHGQARHPYLFSGFVICGHCNYRMFGQTNHGNRRYYRHAHTERVNECTEPRAWVNANELEAVVMRHLFDTFGNPAAIQRAIERATPNLKKLQALRERRDRVEELLKKNAIARERRIRACDDGLLPEDEMRQRLRELKDSDGRYHDELIRIDDELGHTPTAEAIRAVSEQAAAAFKKRAQRKAKGRKRTSARVVAARSLDTLDAMTWKDKRALVELVFTGERADGKSLGIYITWVDADNPKRRHKSWQYEIHGQLIHEQGVLPISEEAIAAWDEDLGGAPQQRALVKRRLVQSVDH